MKDWEYYGIGAAFITLTAVGKTLDKFRKKEITEIIGIASSLIFSVIGGLISGMIASIYIETVQIQWVCIAGGAWMGERILEAVGTAFEDKINLIFKNNNNGKSN